MPRDYERDILQASIRVFGQYGFKKAKMTDIALEADVARQTLYGLYKNKNAVLSATAVFSANEAIRSVKSRITDDMRLSDKIALFCEEYLIAGYMVSQQSVNAKDLLDGRLPIDACANKEIKDKFTALILSFLEPYQKQVNASGLSIDHFSETIYTSLKTAKYEARDVEHLRELHANFIRLVVSNLN